jgi:hypothetical protein
MSNLSRGIFGALAVTMAFGAVQFAFGHDLVGRQTVSLAPQDGVNRVAKADRAAFVPATAVTQTIALRFDSLSDTSVLVRVPVVKSEVASRPLQPQPQISRSGPRKATIACEPVVSVLTEVAKQLQPGRCVT